ncbi:hypothetical protein [Kribbella deserti]|uniref:Uncharacterized protein n=1 Tax=Kribbella deserti TaxID=1926257 RepID=A0ABV6QSV9_9ACTN
MTEEELTEQVRAVAGRAKAEMPVVRMNEPPCKGPHVLYQQAQGQPAELRFCPEVTEMPASIREFLIAQEFVGHQVGLVPRLNRLGTFSVVMALVLSLGINFVTGGSIWAFMGLYVVSYLVIRLISHSIVIRRAQRETDQRLVALLSHDHVVESLNGFAQACPKPALRERVRWVLRGAPPSPRTRLAWLGA